MRGLGLIPLFLLLSLRPSWAEAPIRPPGAPQPGLLCRMAIQAAERAHGIPSGLLAAIGRVETGRPDPVTGEVQSWPWAANAEGQGFFFDSKAQAVAQVRAMQARGVQSIDVGCMQVNLMHHPNAFTSLEQAFDPAANAEYAARFLLDLFGQTHAWPRAAALYHSATPELGADYQRRVMAAWPAEMQRLDGEPRTPLATAWAATLNPGVFPAFRRGQVVRMPPTATAAPAASSPGRGLDSYRAAPIPLAWRPVALRRGE